MGSEISDTANEAFQTAIIDYIESLHLQSTFSDLVIQSKSRNHDAHRIIVAAQSQSLAKSIKALWAEADKAIVDLTHEDSAIVQLAIDFMYTGDYTYGKEEQADDINDILESRMVIDAKTVIFASLYGIPALRQCAIERFEAKCCEIESTKSIVAVIKLIYDPTVHIKDKSQVAIVNSLHKHLDELMSNEVFVKYLRANGELSADLLEVERQRHFTD